MRDFTVRADDELVQRFDAKCGEASRNSVIVDLMQRYVVEQERYESLTIRGYSDDHTKQAEITHHFFNEEVYHRIRGFTGEAEERFIQMFDHATDLMNRREPGDKEQAIALFHQIFGEHNVFVIVKE